MPLVRGPQDQSLEAGGDLLGQAGHVSAEGALSGGVERWLHDGPVIPTGSAVYRTGHQTGSGPKGEGGRAGGHGGGLAEELDLDPVAGHVPVREQPHQLPLPERGHDGASRRGVQRQDGQTHGGALLHEELEQLGRLDPLGHRSHRKVLCGQKSAPILPAPNVRQCHDDAPAQGHPFGQVIKALDERPLLDLDGRGTSQPEPLRPSSERRPERTDAPNGRPGPGRPRRHRAPEPGWPRPSGAVDPARQRGGHPPGCPGSAPPVRGARREQRASVV